MMKATLERAGGLGISSLVAGKLPAHRPSFHSASFLYSYFYFFFYSY
jgi:hypothetical protein